MPFYGHMHINGYYTAWDEDAQTRCAIKDKNVLTVPFKPVPVATRGVTWVDVAQRDDQTG